MTGYLNAQYRFLVKPNGDYTAHFADPDIYLNWSDILQVLIPTTTALSSASASTTHPQAEHEGATCPICLSPPTAPRMTKCGHVYCYPCMLHYLTVGEDTGTVHFSRAAQPEHDRPSTRPGAAPRGRPAAASTTSSGSSSSAAAMPIASTGQASAKTWRRCPICWDAVYARDLKAVRWWDPQHEAQRWAAVQVDGDAGQLLPMRLIERPQITTLALPQSELWPGHAADADDDFLPPHAAPWHFQPDVLAFAKFMLATPELIRDSLQEDLSMLEAERLMVLPTRDEISLQFLQLAKEKVEEQIGKVREECDTQSVRMAIERKKRQMQERRLPETTAPAQPTEAVDASEVADFLATQAQSQPGGQIRTRRNINPPSPLSSSYFYYQAASGQNIFLHPLDIKVLHSKYGSYAAFPRTIHVKVSGADEGSMNEELRRRCKYLTHIPAAADVVFVEVDWETGENTQGSKPADVQPLTIDADVLKPYLTAIRQRKNKRRDRGRKEDRAKVKADEEAAQNAHAKTRLAPSQEYRESAGWPAAEQLGSSYGSANGSGAAAALSTSLGSSTFESTSSNSPSFREAALVGAERTYPIHPVGPQEDFPAVRPPGSPQLAARSGAATTTVWGTPAARTSAAAVRSEYDEHWDRGMDDAWLELEDEYYLGRTKTGGAGARSLRQPASASASSPATPGGGNTPAHDGTQTPTDPSAATPRGKPKKKKLVLTAGGRGQG